MSGTSRSADYKMRSLRFANSNNARSQRIEKQNDNRRMARQAKSNANRGLTELDLNTFSQDKKQQEAKVELTQEQKLQERLNKLKLWREQKIAIQKKEKALKRAPFVVPCHLPATVKSEKVIKDATVKVSERVTRSMSSKEVPPASGKPAQRMTRSTTKIGGIEVKKTPARTRSSRVKKVIPVQKWEVKSFAPSDFVFTAPQGIVEKGLELQKAAFMTEPDRSISETPHTPKTKPTTEEIKISPLLVNNPWITMTRGSSSRKSGRRSLDVNQEKQPDVQASPMLRRRSQEERKTSNEAIAPAADPRNAEYFRALVKLEESRLNALCDMWEEHLASDVPEEETGTVRTVIGQAHLLQRERFVQFCGLIDQFEHKTGEKEITPTDLEGFWEMIYLQVTDVDRKFGELSQLRDDGWVRSQVVAQKKVERAKRKAKEPVAGVVARPRVARSNLRAHIAAARKNQMAVRSPKSPSSNRRRSSLLCSPLRTPGKRQSLRRSALILSAKKQMFIVTDMCDPNDEPRISQYVPDQSEPAPSGDLPVSADPASVKSEGPTPDGRPSAEALKVDPPTAVEESSCQNTETELMDCDDVVLPDQAVNLTPFVQKTYGKTRRSLHDPLSKSPEERMSDAFDALKTEAEDKSTPLKVFRTPRRVASQSKYPGRNAHVPGDGETVEDSEIASASEETARCRRSTRLRNKEENGGRRPSLLPTITVSPAVPKEDLMSFD